MSKHKKSNKKQHAKGIGDITLNDFANAEVCKNRLKKSTCNVTTVIKRIESEKTWDERDDFDEDFVTVNKEVSEDGAVIISKKTGDKKIKNLTLVNTDEVSNTYPLDVWFLISEYIRPEDIARFAGICKSSFAVVCTAKFWFSLYKRHYKSVPSLPDHLQPERLVRLYGLRTSVIRALHFMYPPYVNKFGTITFSEKHPGTLIKQQCILMSFHKQKKDWMYCFKFKENLTSSLPHSRRSEAKQDQKPDLIEMLEDVSANPDENCRILQVTCLHFIAVPFVQGLTLKSASLTLSQGFRHHRLQLGFGSAIHTYSYNNLGGSNSTVIILDPVVSVKVLDWWHPHYPYNHNIEYLLNHD
ncbi:hypothetical protein FQR65_LT09520 [Abscondita terminalis]|nr:hypothetical protein FQR65_LT09520 [Abscondita terminalis]